MESELRHRDKKTTVEDISDASSLNDDYDHEIKKDMRYSYGKTPDGKGTLFNLYIYSVNSLST